MGNPKKLYLGSSVTDLQKKGNLGDTSKWSCKALCSSSEKVFKEAVHQKDQGDEEKAYTLFWKYIECVQKLRKNKEYSKDEKYFSSMHNIQKNSRKAIDALESLAQSLDKRYENKTLEKISKLDQELRQEEPELAILDENSNEDIKNISNIPNGLKTKADDRAHIISVQRLHGLIKEKSTTFFILDTRPSSDYQNSYINLPNSLNVPETILKPGTTAASIGKNLNIQFRSQWERRKTMDMLIICDWTSTDFTPNSPPSVLKDAMTTWDLGEAYPKPPFILEGGFQKFLFAYPHSVSNPKARAPINTRSDLSLLPPNIDSLQYPDLDNGFMITPSPSPKNSAIKSGAITISRGPEATQPTTTSTSMFPHYPSLTGLTSLTPKSSKPGLVSSNSPRTMKKPFTPSVPDRRSKPVESSANGDDFNNAKQSFEIDKDRSSLGSVRSSVGNSQLNQAVLESDTSDGSISMQSDGYISMQSLPKVNRDLKKEAVVKYGMRVDNMEDVLHVENDIAEKSLEREKEQLDLEKKWEMLRLKREAEADCRMKDMLLVEQEELVDELERLRVKDKDKDKENEGLKEELKAIKEELKKNEEEKIKYIQFETRKSVERAKIEAIRKAERVKEEDIRSKEMQRLALIEAVELKRKERKAKEKRRKEEENRIVHRRNEESRDSPLRHVPGEVRAATAKPAHAGSKTTLRSEEDAPKSGGLKRSFSSPNIAQMLENEGVEASRQPRGGYVGVPVPKFDRKQKPSMISNRNFAGVWGTQKPGLTGLRNLGNTCYMNSILQCVSNTPPLAHYFISRSFEEDLNEDHSETKGHVAYEFAEVLKNLWSSQFKSISPSDLKQMVGRFKVAFAGRDQQDSHEFCSKLLEWLHEDTNKVVRPSKEPEQNFRDSRDKGAAVTHWRNYLERNQSIIVQLFCGQTRSVLTCLSCQGESVTYREFTNLTLPLPETSNRISLRECFEEYLREEIIEEVTCESCKKTGRASKKTDIVKLPPLLVIHLSRFYQDGMYTRKKQNFVHFDLKNLNIGQYAKEGFENKHNMFSLYAVSNHFGSLEGGHYTAYCSSSVLKRWHKFDDQDVSTMDSKDVVTPAAYILFYSAIEGQTSLPPLG